MNGYKTIRCNNDVLRIFCPNGLGFKNVIIIEPIKQVKEGAFQMNILYI